MFCLKKQLVSRLFSLGAAIVLPAIVAQAVDFSFTISFDADPTGTFVLGDSYELTFSLNDDLDSEISLYSSGNNLFYYVETVPQGPLWNDISLNGLGGSYAFPTLLEWYPYDIANAYFDSGRLQMFASNNGGYGLGLDASGSIINSFNLDATFAGLTLADPGALISPGEYYADYFGTYALESQNSSYFSSSAGDSQFTISSLTISPTAAVPEPATSALALGALALACVGYRRMRR
ncbi:MAG: hypothetical protein E1N59_3054 [Puniceicoccaceae bacterium 5H]|nr:MAG: hypothetical protein E1N59_3054 [Puniceicoccaceae bacterium 5H]